MCGIYAIARVEEDKIEIFYIGQSINIEQRFKEHLRSKNHNPVMTHMMKYYKGKVFLIILEECRVWQLDYKEVDHYIILSRHHWMANDPRCFKHPVEEMAKRVKDYEDTKYAFSWLEQEISQSASVAVSDEATEEKKEQT